MYCSTCRATGITETVNAVSQRDSYNLNKMYAAAKKIVQTNALLLLNVDAKMRMLLYCEPVINVTV